VGNETDWAAWLQKYSVYVYDLNMYNILEVSKFPISFTWGLV